VERGADGTFGREEMQPSLVDKKRTEEKVTVKGKVNQIREFAGG